MCACVCVFVIPLIILAYLVWKLYKSGIFDNVEVSVSDNPPFVDKPLTVYYKHHIGPYKRVGKHLERARSLMPDNVVAFGIYYDNPHETKEHLLQSISGVVFGIDGKDLYDEEYGNILKEAGYEKLVLPAVEKAVVANQKFDGVFSFIALAKFTYPKINLYVQKNRLHFRFAIEFYCGHQVNVVLPLDHQTDFFVPEIMSLEELEKKLASSGPDTYSESESDSGDDDDDGGDSEDGNSNLQNSSTPSDAECNLETKPQEIEKTDKKNE